MANISVTKVNGQSHSDVEKAVLKENGHHEDQVEDSVNKEIPRVIYLDKGKLMKAKKIISENQVVTLERIEEEEEDSASDSEGEREWRREDEEDRAGFEIDIIEYIEDEEERRTLVCYI